MQYTNDHHRASLAELPSPDDVISCQVEDGTIQMTSPSLPLHNDPIISHDDENHDHDSHNKVDVNCNVESYNNKSKQTHECIVEIQDPLTKTTTRSSTLARREDVINDIEEDDHQSNDENSLSPRKKRIIQISWYIIIAAFLTAFPMFATGIVLGIIAYSSRPGSQALRKPADSILSVSIFLIGVGISFLIAHYVRRRCGCWLKKRGEEMRTEFTNAIDDETSMVCQEPPAS